MPGKLDQLMDDARLRRFDCVCVATNEKPNACGSLSIPLRRKGTEPSRKASF
jgi:hypothetical protein